MASIEFSGFEDYRARVADLGRRIPGICKYAIYDAAKLVEEEIRAATPEKTGDLKDSVYLLDFKTEGGYIHTAVYFGGYDENGVPNPLKARAIESGHSTPKGKVGKHPFIRKAVERAADRAEAIIAEKLDEKIEEIMNE